MNYSYYRSHRKPPKRQSSFSSFFWFVVFLMLLVLAIKVLVSAFGDIREEKRDEAILTVDRGSAEVILWGHDEGSAASSAQIILEGDTIVTKGSSNVTLSFQNGSEVSLDEDSRLIFSSFETDGDDDFVTLDLVKGRAFVTNKPKEKGIMELTLKTDLMDLLSYSGDYLAKNSSSEEYVYGVDGQITVSYVDRSGPESLAVEKLTLGQGSKSVFDSSKRQSFLARDSVLLIEEAEDDLAEDSFYLWNDGQILLESNEEEPELEPELESEPEPDPEPEEEAEPEPEIEEPIEESLEISIVSPVSGSTITKDAIALEGRIQSGNASKITVTWSGNGEAYPLGLFEPGDSSFRYVADVEYGNFALGENTYTIVAYDEEGEASNTVVVQLTADF